MTEQDDVAFALSAAKRAVVVRDLVNDVLDAAKDDGIDDFSISVGLAMSIVSAFGDDLSKFNSLVASYKMIADQVNDVARKGMQ